MAPRTSPTLLRRELGGLLRGYREERHLTAVAVAKATYIKPTQISRLETGQRPPQELHVQVLCQFYGLDSQTTEQLMQMALEAREEGWWDSYDLEEPTEEYISLEAAASHIDNFEFTVIPGILQTRGYATEVVRPVRAAFSEERIAQTVESRLARQSILTGDSPVQYHAILDEGVLHRTIGGGRTMRDQLHHLIEVSERPNVTVQVLPFSAGANPGLDGAFAVLHFTGDLPSAAYTEGQLGQTFQYKPGEVERCLRAFRTLADLAADEETTRQIIRHQISAITI